MAIINELREHCLNFLSASIDINVTGHIDASLEAAIQRLHAALMANKIFRLKLAWPSWGIGVHIINSPGGDVDVALRVGKMLRDFQAWVSVEEECSSSCVFLLAGATQRIPSDARIGVHRAYYQDLSPTVNPGALSQDYRERRQRVAQFLADMNIPTSLLEAMDAIRPEQMHYLTKAELAAYRLDGTDAVFEERLIARNAAQRGITSAEFRQRTAVAEASCNKSACDQIDKAQLQAVSECWQRYSDCHMAILWGLSVPEFQKRFNEVRARCPLMPFAITSERDFATGGNCEKELMLSIKMPSQPTASQSKLHAETPAQTQSVEWKAIACTVDFDGGAQVILGHTETIYFKDSGRVHFRGAELPASVNDAEIQFCSGSEKGNQYCWAISRIMGRFSAGPPPFSGICMTQGQQPKF
jgi:hypothetical protein